MGGIITVMGGLVGGVMLGGAWGLPVLLGRVLTGSGDLLAPSYYLTMMVSGAVATSVHLVWFWLPYTMTRVMKLRRRWLYAVVLLTAPIVGVAASLLSSLVLTLMIRWWFLM